jgi:pyridoxamine 5'-phosphate oxidase-like protein
MRATGQRKSDAIEKLKKDQDVWVATADDRGVAHLVPLSLCWHEGMVVVAVEARSRTARNASASGQARLALGPSRDVVMIDAGASVVARPDAGPAIAGAYRERTGWEPGSDGGEWVYILLRPARIQVWRDVDEIAGRTVMRDGTWLA